MTSHLDSDAIRSAEWVREHLDQFQTDEPDYRLVEVDMDPGVYDDWHIPGAVQINWEEDIIDGLGGNVVDQSEAESLFGELGITRDTTVVVYGDQANWFAGHAYWVLRYYQHENVQLLDGGRRSWRLEGYEQTQDEPEYPSCEYTIDGTNEDIRGYKHDIRESLDEGRPIIDVRNPQEYRGEKPPAEIPNTTDREGHIPTAANVPWGKAVNADGTFKPESELRDIYGEYIDPDSSTVAYCRIGERSSITWFVLSELLGADAVNYDGSWTEWAADETAPVEDAPEPAVTEGDF
ncbi:thiosulfate/3-mercaptopyruvate sulfurtransferase [Halovenus aranensis]|uniref:Sulfurtransferase n=1 Tax=Halovenus aranensis TaxID=890420 RepID=A0A1G8Y5A8_9EURY|nr:sulfurtransferase [Halovenus aranensis]SDJ97827.1 thiosulfate/3-mercaptopyruvate sulfurtransferase [Halovenus aranensis]